MIDVLIDVAMGAAGFILGFAAALYIMDRIFLEGFRR
jgi:hypothetical protein